MGSARDYGSRDGHKILYRDKQLIVIHVKDFIVIRLEGEYKQHSHFKDMKGAKELITLYNKRLVPYHPYFKTAMERICTPKEFAEFTDQKKKEVYRNKGNRR